LVAGFLAAPPVPCALLAIFMSAAANQWSSLLFGIVAMVVVSEALGFVVGLPRYLVLSRFRTIGVLECVLSGIVVAVLFNVLSLSMGVGASYSAGDGGESTVVDGHMTAHGYMSALLATAIQSVLGLSVGLCFWIIAIRRAVHAHSDLKKTGMSA